MDIKDLITAAANAAGAQEPHADIAALVEHAKEARQHVWDWHYAGTAERGRLAEKLAASPPEFQRAVAVTEKALAEELADSSARRARIRAENPSFFKD
ncbi:hypothetical protein A6U84_03290 [Agrobacterium sp. 13-2099-1-2]|jgi:hypothetical protein|uniref:hypothetical protein n=1 Tax=Agrobacterium sp. 13-2099-1-2 TaxID=1841651 RepID=UPI00080F94A7|nr:hypothetical protein [Agrobacterium sp. 13-2099-1-2]UZX42348.1 hypothetical protein A6U84_03290 [Agrobacterium sp. 13-2099-1-2]